MKPRKGAQKIDSLRTWEDEDIFEWADVGVVFAVCGSGPGGRRQNKISFPPSKWWNAVINFLADSEKRAVTECRRDGNRFSPKSALRPSLHQTTTGVARVSEREGERVSERKGKRRRAEGKKLVQASFFRLLLFLGVGMKFRNWIINYSRSR